MTELKCGITWDSHIHAGKHHCAQLLNEHSGSHTCDQCDAKLPRGETPRDIDDFSEYKRGFQDAQKMLAPPDDKDAIIGQ